MSARDLTPEQRRGRGTKLCARLAADVAAIAPPGIGAWKRAWEITAAADVEFMAALSAWEVDPTPATLARTRAAYTAVVDAWRDAAGEYEAQERSAP